LRRVGVRAIGQLALGNVDFSLGLFDQTITLLIEADLLLEALKLGIAFLDHVHVMCGLHDLFLVFFGFVLDLLLKLLETEPRTLPAVVISHSALRTCI
jgi:hypothetical protein